MSQRARYDGAYEEVFVYDPETGNQVVVDTVKRGGLLSKDVPARIRDSLLDTPEWTAVDGPGSSKSEKE